MKYQSAKFAMPIAVLFCATTFSSPLAQTLSGQAEKPLAKLDSAPSTSRTVGEVRRVEILAGTEDEQASLQLSKAVDDFVLGFTFTTPIDRDDKAGKLATLDGLSDSIRGEFRLTYTPWRMPPANKKSLAACEKAAKLFEYEDPEYAIKNCGTTLFSLGLGQRMKLANKGYTDAKIAALEEKAELLEENFDISFFGDKPMIFYSLTTALGTEEFEYRDPVNLEKKEDNETEWSIEASVAVYLVQSEWYFNLAARYEEAFKPTDKETRCPPSTSTTPVVCFDDEFAGAKEDNAEVLSLEAKKIYKKIGFAPKVSYDFEDDVVGVDFPIYLATNSKEEFTGGIKLGWRNDDDDLIASIFIGAPLKLF